MIGDKALGCGEFSISTHSRLGGKRSGVDISDSTSGEAQVSSWRAPDSNFRLDWREHLLTGALGFIAVSEQKRV